MPIFNPSTPFPVFNLKSKRIIVVKYKKDIHTKVIYIYMYINFDL